MLTTGYGVSIAEYGRVFPYVFTLPVNYYDGTEPKVNFLANKLGGYDKLEGIHIVYYVFKSTYGLETKPVIEALSKRYNFKATYVEGKYPGMFKDQTKDWKNIIKLNPNYVFLRAWGPSAVLAYKSAKSFGFPVNKIISVWWSGATSDFPGNGDAEGVITADFFAPSLSTSLLSDLKLLLYDQGKGAQESFD